MINVISALAAGQNVDVYGELAGTAIEQHKARYARLWQYLNKHGMNKPEYLLPQIQVQTTVQPFSFERRFLEEKKIAPSLESVRALDPWVYEIEFSDSVKTKYERHPADWKYHRYRADMLIGLAAAIAGDKARDLSVMDVGCHCGVMALEFAERGFGSVRGNDLRKENIDQARFLQSVFDVKNLEFETRNARDIKSLPKADIVFCAGLLYHVTFPMELLSDLAALTGEFLILDSLMQNHPFGGFHLFCQRNVSYSADGEFAYEFHPTYRAVCEGLEAVGFKTIYEIFGSEAADVPIYDRVNTRSFIASKREDGLLADFLKAHGLTPAQMP